MNAILAVYRKELLDIVRDRRTILFMLAFPLLVVPLLTIGVSKFAFNLAMKRAVEQVVIAASPRDQALWRELVHAQFRQSEIARLIRLTQNPLTQFLAPKSAESNSLAPNAAVLTDAGAYDIWLRKVVAEIQKRAKELEKNGLGSLPWDQLQGLKPPTADGSNKTAADLSDFYMVSVRGLALVRFVDPATHGLARGKGEGETEWHARIKVELEKGDLHGVLRFAEGAEKALTSKAGAIELEFLWNSATQLSDEAESRIRRVVQASSGAVLRERLDVLKQPTGYEKPVALKENRNLATKRQITFSALGGILPYLIMAFAFIGGMYPALDFGAGEKERQTLETLLLTPASRTSIALGKFLVVLTSSLTTAGLGIGSLAVMFVYFVPKPILAQLDLNLGATQVIALLLLAVPPCAASSGVFLAISVFARSMREAQSYLAPVPLLFILPAGAGMIPGLEISTKLALIPLVNVSLVSREILKGEVPWCYFAMTVGSCGMLALICVAACVWMFRRESVLFRV